MRNICVVFVFGITLFLSTGASAAVIGPWPAWSTYMWDTQPLAPYTSGAVSITGTPPADLLLMAAPTGITKTSWLPYGGTYAEKMAIVQLQGVPAITTEIHAKVYDPATAGKSGWAVILKDGDGKILDFGIRGFFQSQAIYAHQYDGTAWTVPYQPVGTRTRTGNNYYTMDFDHGEDGTITWTIDAYENGATWTYTNTTTVVYGPITEIYLSTATPDTTGAANYKWTEFWIPEPSGLALLTLGSLVMVRRRRV